MKQVALEVAQFIEEEGHATVGENLFVDALPDVEEEAIAVFTTGGTTPDIDLPVPSPNFEILIRGESASSCFTKIESIISALHQTYNQTLVTDGNYYYSILLNGEINSLGRDEKGRIEYSANFRCKVRGR